MRFFLIVLFAAFGLVFVFEGLCLFAMPFVSREVGRWVLRRGDTSLRLIGLAMMAAGLALVYAVLRLGGSPP